MNSPTTWRAVPEDFRVTYTLDVRGCPMSCRIGLTQLQQAHMSRDPSGWLRVRNWTEQCGQELKTLMSKQLGIPESQLVIMSNQERMDTLEVWVRSRVPIPRVAIDTPEKSPITYLPSRKSRNPQSVIDI